VPNNCCTGAREADLVIVADGRRAPGEQVVRRFRLAEYFFMRNILLKTITLLMAILSFCHTASAAQRRPVGLQNIENTLGVIVLSKDYRERDYIQIYNPDGSLWYKFTYYYDDKNGQFPYRNTEFQPFAFHPDYFLLSLKCVAKVGDRYEVVVNEETGLTKYVRADDRTLALEAWESHVSKVFSVEFDPRTNPLLKDRQGQRKIIFPKDTFFHPVKTRGDWLMIKWEIKKSTKPEKESYAYGWIKWKAKEKLLIELYYFA
jgi:hypothetical protein